MSEGRRCRPRVESVGAGSRGCAAMMAQAAAPTLPSHERPWMPLDAQGDASRRSIAGVGIVVGREPSRGPWSPEVLAPLCPGWRGRDFPARDRRQRVEGEQRSGYRMGCRHDRERDRATEFVMLRPGGVTDGVEVATAKVFGKGRRRAMCRGHAGRAPRPAFEVAPMSPHAAADQEPSKPNGHPPGHDENGDVAAPCHR